MPIVDEEMLLIFGYIIVLGTMVGFSLYMQSVKMIGSVKASLIACVEPVASTVLTVLWMKVKFTMMDLIGFVMVIATIFILAIPVKNKKQGDEVASK